MICTQPLLFESYRAVLVPEPSAGSLAVVALCWVIKRRRLRAKDTFSREISFFNKL